MLKYTGGAQSGAAFFLSQMATVGVMINLVLMVLNLLPLPPLDGGRIAVSLLPMDLAVKLSRLEQYGFIIIMALLFTGILGKIISPIINFVAQIIFGIFA